MCADDYVQSTPEQIRQALQRQKARAEELRRQKAKAHIGGPNRDSDVWASAGCGVWRIDTIWSRGWFSWTPLVPNPQILHECMPRPLVRTLFQWTAPQKWSSIDLKQFQHISALLRIQHFWGLFICAARRLPSPSRSIGVWFSRSVFFGCDASCLCTPVGVNELPHTTYRLPDRAPLGGSWYNILYIQRLPSKWTTLLMDLHWTPSSSCGSVGRDQTRSTTTSTCSDWGVLTP